MDEKHRAPKKEIDSDKAPLIIDLSLEEVSVLLLSTKATIHDARNLASALTLALRDKEIPEDGIDRAKEVIALQHLVIEVNSRMEKELSELHVILENPEKIQIYGPEHLENIRKNTQRL